jgi:hypothetical protein
MRRRTSPTFACVTSGLNLWSAWPTEIMWVVAAAVELADELDDAGPEAVGLGRESVDIKPEEGGGACAWAVLCWAR